MPGSMQQHFSHNVYCHWMTGKEVGLGCVDVALLWCSAPWMPKVWPNYLKNPTLRKIQFEVNLQKQTRKKRIEEKILKIWRFQQFAICKQSSRTRQTRISTNTSRLSCKKKASAKKKAIFAYRWSVFTPCRQHWPCQSPVALLWVL